MSSINAQAANNPITDAPALETNPLFLLERGLQLVPALPPHRKSAALGNLYYEYVRDVASLRGIVRSGAEVGEYLAAKGLLIIDRAAGRYMWKGEPLSKAAFLKMLRPTPPLAVASNE